MEIINSLLPYLPIILTIIGILILLLIIYIVVLVWQAKKKQKQSEEDSEKAKAKKAQKEAIASQKLLSANLSRSFKQAIRILRSETSGRNWRYQIPWMLAIGESYSGKTTALENVGLDLTLGKSETKPGSKSICDWYFYDKGVMLDIDGSAILRKDGLPTDEKVWKTLLRLLQKHRPERPIDGIVLTISATDLIAPIEEVREILRAKADTIYKKLIQVQVTLGLCVPVYVLVTKCDAIPGFRSFAGALPQQFRDQIFGWSNPYALETAFSPRWVDEAFETVSGNLYETQIELFSTQNFIDNRDELFMFVSDFERMIEPAREFIGDIFKQSVYHEQIFFRGMYFTGDGSPAAVPHPEITALLPQTEYSPSESATGKIVPLFLKDLFEKKIFPEFNIVRPVTKVAVTRNRTILITQVVMALLTLSWGIGMYVGYSNLIDKKQALLPFLSVLASTDAPAKQQNVPAGMPQLPVTQTKEEKSQIDESIINSFLTYANARDGARLSSYFIPSSWFSPIHSKITDCMSLKYDKFILKVLYYGLDKRTRQVVAPAAEAPRLGYISSSFAPVDSAANLPVVQRVEQTPDFVNLRNYVDALVELERNSENYNKLCEVGQGDLSEVGGLIKYLFNVDLSASFSSDQAYYFSKAVILSEAQKFLPAEYQKDAEARLTQLSQAFFERTFSRNPLIARCDRIRSLTYSLINFGQSGQSLNRDGLVARKLYETLSELETTLGRPEVSWITADSLNLGSAYLKLTSALSRSAFVEIESAQQLSQMSQDGFQRLKTTLMEQKTAYSAPIFAAADKKLALSDQAKSLKTALEKLLSQEFMLTEPSPYTSNAGSHIVWNITMLEDVNRRVENSMQFVAQALPLFPLQLVNPVRAIATFQIEADARSRIMQAQTASGAFSVTSEENIKTEIQYFSEAAGFLSKLITTFEQKQLTSANRYLAEIVAGQAGGLLSDVDKLLEQKQAYTVEDSHLSSWNGRKQLSTVIFGVRQDGDLSEFVLAQQKLVRIYAAAYARPLVTFLNSPAIRSKANSTTTVLPKWAGILEQIDFYDTKVAGNSLAALDNFILLDVDSVTVDNYAAKIPLRSFQKVPADYFQDKLFKMKRAIYSRAQAISESEAIGFYSASEQYFNQHLAGKYPFVSTEQEQLGQIVNADPEEVRTFFKISERLGPPGRDALKKNPSYTQDSRNEVARFLTNIDVTRKFFNGYVSSEQKNPALGFDAEIEFRANQKAENGGYQILDWSLWLGNTRVSNRDADRKARWYWGSPVKLALRWAKDAPYSPAIPDLNANYRVEDKTVIYEFQDRWSLLQFIKSHKVPMADDEDDAPSNQNLLEFSIPTISTTGGSTAMPTQTKVFIKVNLLSPEKKNGLVLPPFPAQSPRLVKETQQLKN